MNLKEQQNRHKNIFFLYFHTYLACVDEEIVQPTLSDDGDIVPTHRSQAGVITSLSFQKARDDKICADTELLDSLLQCTVK
jgi:hypothetical protein